MTIYFYDGQVLFRSSSVAMSENCCCVQCECVPRFLTQDFCTECAAADYVDTFSTPRDAQFTITGVAVGNRTGCLDVNCSGPTATHTAFFNRTVTLSPCESLQEIECIYRGCTYNIGGNTFYLLEVNMLTMQLAFVTGAWVASVEMHSWIGYNQQIGTPGSTVACNAVTQWAYNDANITLAFSDLVSHRSVDFQHELDPGTATVYLSDPATCPPETCDNGTTVLVKCPQDGEFFTPQSPSSTSTTCEAALDVAAASLSVEVV